MENATQFSPPDSHVEIVGHKTRDGNYVLSVSDQGIGMSAEQLADANKLMANPPVVGLALSRSLGFIVIGRLAARFGIVVRLTSSPSGGVSALVSLPNTVIDVQAPPEAVHAGGVRGTERRVVDHRSDPADELHAPVSPAPAAPADFVPNVDPMVRPSGPIVEPVQPVTARTRRSSRSSGPGEPSDLVVEPVPGVASPAALGLTPVAEPTAAPPVEVEAIAAPVEAPLRRRAPPSPGSLRASPARVA